jgi:hypothetical protein
MRCCPAARPASKNSSQARSSSRGPSQTESSGRFTRGGLLFCGCLSPVIQTGRGLVQGATVPAQIRRRAQGCGRAAGGTLCEHVGRNNNSGDSPLSADRPAISTGLFGSTPGLAAPDSLAQKLPFASGGRTADARLRPQPGQEAADVGRTGQERPLVNECEGLPAIQQRHRVPRLIVEVAGGRQSRCGLVVTPCLRRRPATY